RPRGPLPADTRPLGPLRLRPSPAPATSSIAVAETAVVAEVDARLLDLLFARSTHALEERVDVIACIGLRLLFRLGIDGRGRFRLVGRGGAGGGGRCVLGGAGARRWVLRHPATRPVRVTP